jgi:centrosomal protein CEP120
MDDVRQTPEYAAAWDLELWKSTQVAKFQRELKDKERKLLAELAARVAKKEADDGAAAGRALRDADAKAAQLRKDGELLDRKKQRLRDLEAELRGRLAEADEFRKRLEADADDRVARVKQEVLHKLELQHFRATEAAEHGRRVEERAAAGQKEYLKLWEEFSDFKTKALAQAGPLLTTQLEAMRTQHESQLLLVTERHDRRVMEMAAQYKAQLDALSGENQRLAAQAAGRRSQGKVQAAAAGAVGMERDDAVREVQRLRQHVAALEGQQQQQQQQGHAAADAQQRQALKQSVTRHAASEPHAAAAAQRPSGDAEAAAIRDDIARWERERLNLLSNCGGAYTSTSDVIVKLDDCIRTAARSLARA